MRWSWWITKICHLQIIPTALNIDSAAWQLHVQKCSIGSPGMCSGWTVSPSVCILSRLRSRPPPPPIPLINSQLPRSLGYQNHERGSSAIKFISRSESSQLSCLRITNLISSLLLRIKPPACRRCTWEKKSRIAHTMATAWKRARTPQSAISLQMMSLALKNIMIFITRPSRGSSLPCS